MVIAAVVGLIAVFLAYILATILFGLAALLAFFGRNEGESKTS